MLRYADGCHAEEKIPPHPAAAHGRAPQAVARPRPAAGTTLVLAEIRREAAMLSKHPEDAAIDDWLDKVRDPDDWS